MEAYGLLASIHRPPLPPPPLPLRHNRDFFRSTASKRLPAGASPHSAPPLRLTSRECLGLPETLEPRSFFFAIAATGDRNGEERDGAGSQRASKRPRLHVRGEDDYLPGNIIEIEIHNFMTYDHLTCKPGSGLNLVIGPNGSGKSSLVCAITLGLAGEPQLLGRASSFGVFVKRGEESGYVRISLRGNFENETISITRKIDTHNKSEWTLNDMFYLVDFDFSGLPMTNLLFSAEIYAWVESQFRFISFSDLETKTNQTKPWLAT